MAGHHSHHDHSHGLTGRNLLYSILLNIGITLAQFIGGLISGSLALLSDAVHNLSDVISLIISYIANKITRKKADFSKTFGYRRAEILAAFINAATLIVLAIFLIKESIFRFFDEPESIGSGIVIWMAILSIIGNGVSVLLLYKDSDNNMNIRSSYLHLLTDMFTSVAVMIGGILMKYYEILWIDSLLTFGIGTYLIYMGYNLLKESFNVLMLFSPEDIPIDKLVKEINTIPGVKNLHHVHVWMLNEHNIHLEGHVDLEEDFKISDFDAILDEIVVRMKENFGIDHVNIQPEFAKNDDKSVVVQEC